MRLGGAAGGMRGEVAAAAGARQLYKDYINILYKDYTKIISIMPFIVKGATRGRGVDSS